MYFLIILILILLYYKFPNFQESYANYPFEELNIDDIKPIYLENYLTNKNKKYSKEYNIKEYNDDDYDGLLIDLSLDKKIHPYNKGIIKNIKTNKEFKKYIYPDTKITWIHRKDINRPWY